VDISLSKNTVLGDKCATSPGGVRIGTSALTTRGLKETDFIYVGQLIHETINIAFEIQENNKSLKEFIKNMDNYKDKLNDLKKRVNIFALNFEFIE
jgi:glycine hydroxymethyltransferase